MTGKQLVKKLASVGIKAEVTDICDRHEAEMSKTAYEKARKHLLLAGTDFRPSWTGWGTVIVNVSGDHSGDVLRELVRLNID